MLDQRLLHAEGDRTRQYALNDIKDLELALSRVRGTFAMPDLPPRDIERLFAALTDASFEVRRLDRRAFALRGTVS